MRLFIFLVLFLLIRPLLILLDYLNSHLIIPYKVKCTKWYGGKLLYVLGFDISTKAFRGSHFDYQRVCMERMSVIKKALSSV